MSPVTRFAPSPTGSLHIGSARTALFNRLFADRHGGVMRLRIEDTDRARSTEPAVEAIFDSLRWLDIAWDGDPVFQSKRCERHRDLARHLLDRDRAYRCYCSPETLDAMRARARAAGLPPRYDGRCRTLPATARPSHASYSIRLRTPLEGRNSFQDGVHGAIATPCSDIDDFIVLRQDGTPTYMLAVVADDHDMGITDVIRGADHLTNAARQLQLYAALEWRAPKFAHIPLILSSDGAKLSKRHGALGVLAYQRCGYLSSSVCAYLARLGWSHGDDEYFSRDALTRLFDLDAVGRSPARFDSEKLSHTGAHFLRSADLETIESGVRDLHRSLGNQVDTEDWRVDVAALEGAFDNPVHRARFARALPSLQVRATNLVTLARNASFLFRENPIPVESAARTILLAHHPMLRDTVGILRRIDPWDAGTIECAVRSGSAALGVPLGNLARPLRAALTGSTISAGIFDVLNSLGKEESLSRISDASSRFSTSSDPGNGP